jgi:GNAT superfamily N-acetyltransferase
MTNMRLAMAREDDVGLVFSFIRKLAEFEKLAHVVTATEEGLREALFGARPVAEVVLAYEEEEPAGFALFFPNFSTFRGRAGLYLEDLFVEPEHRGKGIGKALLVHLAKLAVERGYGRVQWVVLDWNTPAIEFYRKLGAEGMDEWKVMLVTGEALERLACSQTG